jgi:hypothetical protein
MKKPLLLIMCLLVFFCKNWAQDSSTHSNPVTAANNHNWPYVLLGLVLGLIAYYFMRSNYKNDQTGQ